MFVKLCFKLKLHEKDLFLMKVIILVTWCTNFCPTDGTCPENGTVSCAAVEVQTSWSGNPWNTLLCQNYLMKQQRAVWACGASQALVRPCSWSQSDDSSSVLCREYRAAVWGRAVSGSWWLCAFAKAVGGNWWKRLLHPSPSAQHQPPARWALTSASCYPLIGSSGVALLV